jgi:hypothetical protein
LPAQWASAAETGAQAGRPLRPIVEVEEDVYGFHPAHNGASPMWCYGSTCLVRMGDEVFASGLETLADAKPLNNVRWTLWKRTARGWQLQQADPEDRTREPCPLGCFTYGRLFLSVNPTLVEDPEARAGPARPEILQFRADDPKAPYRTLLPDWKEKPRFTEHSYRSFAADGERGELILFQNVGYTHSQWAFLGRDGRWITGKLVWPEREDPKFAPYDSTRARVNYPNVLLRDRAVHFCGASAFNKWDRVRDAPELMGRKWSNRWRRLYYTWTPDVTAGEFQPWVRIASTEKTGGWLFGADLWLDGDGRVHLLWMEYPIGRELRDRHFPDIPRITSLQYAVVVDGGVRLRRTLVQGGEGVSGVTPNSARFHVTPDGRLLVFYYVEGTDTEGKAVCENRLMEVFPNGRIGEPVTVPMKHPLGGFLGFFTATPRGGSPPSPTLDVLGYRAHEPGTPRTPGKYKLHGLSYPNKISYARIRIE